MHTQSVAENEVLNL